MDNELLIKLLEKHNRLIVPSLGAFLKKEQDGANVIVYTPFLKKDDGVLATAISEYFGTNADESAIIIEEFVRQVTTLLEQSGSYEIAGVGTLKRDVNGSIVLINEPTHKPIVHVQPPPIIPAQPIKQPVATASPEPIAPIAPQPIAPQPMRQPIQPRPQPAVVRPSTPQPKYPVTPPSPIASRPLQPQQGASVRPTQNPQQRPNPNANRPNQPPRRPANRPNPSRNSQPKLDIWLIIAIVSAILVIALLIYGYINTDPSIDLTPILDETTINDTIQ